MSEVKCPRCGSNQISANKKGFSAGKAVAGAVVAGGVGLLAGTIGSGDVLITCLSCGNQWEPKALAKQKEIERFENEVAWRSAFIAAYDAGNYERATSIYKSKFPEEREGWKLEISYKAQKIIQERQGKSNTMIWLVIGLAALAFLAFILK